MGELARYSDKKKGGNSEVKVGDVVLVQNENAKRLVWPLARVKDVILGKGGKVRVVRLATANGELIRPVQRLFPLELSCDLTEIDVNAITKKATTTPISKKEKKVLQPSKGIESEKVNKITVTRSGRVVKEPRKFDC